MSTSILTNNRYDRHKERQKWANDNQHICYLPYSSLQFFHSSKYVSPCCNLIKTNETDYLKPIFQIKDAVKNKETWKNCSVCYKCEDTGKISERTRYLIELTDTELDKFLENQNSPHINIHCTFSNLCNMACRSCNIHTSSLFAKIETGSEFKTATISDDINYWNTMLETINQEVTTREQVNLVISGGEGFVQPDFKKLLDWLIKTNLSQKVNLTVNTNGIVDNEKFINFLCGNFKQVSLAVSVDSIYENYHYVRWPMTWKKIEENLETFSYYRKNTTNFTFFLTPVWSINNIFYVSDWILYFAKFKEKHQFPYFFAYDTPLFQPAWLDINNMPAYLKKLAAEDIKKILDNNWLNENKSLNANLNNLFDMLNNKDFDQKYWDTYLRKTAEWDIKTNASLEVYNKKFYNLLSDADKEKYLYYYNLAPI
jgi:organic radical activating enzyme